MYHIIQVFLGDSNLTDGATSSKTIFQILLLIGQLREMFGPYAKTASKCFSCGWEPIY
ncbi:13938_t:CDS:2 [Gigaspora rosea]|nr:13938_t:CDS:2 [Gigaspora rosea]